MIAVALKNWRLVLAGIATVALLLAAWWLIETGRDIERAGQARASVKAYEERTRIDEKLDGLSPRDLCLAAGGGRDCDGLRDGSP
ncbi:hypothetical protein [Pleomorphomonas sp. JP5]|uniref:hypothetical protein n=1 Tax=Pleomorphomonas sp. JP5 TaxID=2942998 RepID=UPI00204428FE|nr:hypothetical protein [Pleomorphomonas sp. JP5]MCM5558474.1 hypothetical protein [Pleomorphomonas sp. JP5]